MEEPKIKRRRTSTKHSQTGCKTCKTRHIKCDETRPRCMNCEKGDRECIYASKSPQPLPLPPPSAEPPAIASSMPYFTDPFGFRPGSGQAPNLPSSTPVPSQQYPFEDIYSSSQHSSQPFDGPPQFGSRRSSASGSASITPSPHMQHPTSIPSSALVRNAVLVNNVQSQSLLHQAIHSFSEDFRLRGQPFTIESILTPIIYRSNSLKFAVFANFILQANQIKRSPTSSPLQHERYYNNAITHLQTTLNDPRHLDSNVGTLLWLAFYNICRGDSVNWNLNMRSAADQIRLRGSTLDTHPLSMHTKFLFSLWVRADIVASNATGTPANFDRELARIAYSGVPISNKLLLPSRIDLEMLLAELSLFQFECANPLPIGGAWHYSPADLHRKYEDVLGRLGRWQAATSELVAFEEAQPGEYHHGAMLPPEMGLPLLSNDQEIAQLWSLHCAAVVHLHSIASRHHLIPRIPDEGRQIAILYCRILSGMSILNPAEPSVTDLWPLTIMSWALDFASGKIWVAEQLQSIATRYLNRSASIVARKVQQATIHDEDPTILTRIDAASTVPIQGKLVIPDLSHSWPTSVPSTSDENVYHTYVANEKMAASGSMSDPSRAYFPE